MKEIEKSLEISGNVWNFQEKEKLDKLISSFNVHPEYGNRGKYAAKVAHGSWGQNYGIKFGDLICIGGRIYKSTIVYRENNYAPQNEALYEIDRENFEQATYDRILELTKEYYPEDVDEFIKKVDGYGEHLCERKKVNYELLIKDDTIIFSVEVGNNGGHFYLEKTDSYVTVDYNGGGFLYRTANLKDLGSFAEEEFTLNSLKIALANQITKIENGFIFNNKYYETLEDISYSELKEYKEDDK